MGGGPYFVAQGGSRILDASRVDQSGADDANVINWSAHDDFILAVNINSGGKDTEAAQYKLRWKVSGGSFADVGAATPISYAAVTDLVNGAGIAVGGRKCDSQGDTWQSGEEVEGTSLSDSIDLPADYETEIHFALDCSRSGFATYEFELYDSTLGVTRGTCGATLGVIPYLGTLGGSRILNATRVDQSGADDVDVTNWTKANDFILAANIHCDGDPCISTMYDLKWRDVTDDSAFVVINNVGEINWNGATDLVNANDVVIGERACDSQGYTWIDGEEVEGDYNQMSRQLTNDNETEFHWAIDCSGADDGHQYEFQVYGYSAGGEVGTCGAKITMAGAAPPEGIARRKVHGGLAGRGLVNGGLA